MKETGPAAARVGCSGWDYRSWVGPFYPRDVRAADRFAFYAQRFTTVELNATFYRLPSVDTVERWRGAAPGGFRYAVKVAQFATHRRKLREPDTWVPHHLDRVEHLGAHLGPNLLQLPPRWRRDVPRLADALSALPRRHRWAVELRDPSWLHDDVFACLADHGVALCVHDMVEDHPWERTTDWTYVRCDDGCAVWAYFNNDLDAAAPRDAAWLRDRLAPDRDRAAPADVP